MADLSEPLKRIYNYLDSLHSLALDDKTPHEVEGRIIDLETSIRGYVDVIAESVDFDLRDCDEPEAEEAPYGKCHDCGDPLDVDGYCTGAGCFYYEHLQNQPKTD